MSSGSLGGVTTIREDRLPNVGKNRRENPNDLGSFG